MIVLYNNTIIMWEGVAVMKKYKNFIIYGIILLIACYLPFFEEWKFNIKGFIEFTKQEHYTNMFNYLTYANGKIFILIYPLIISYVSIKKFHELYHSGMLNQICERESYKVYIKKEILKIYLNNALVYFCYIWLMFFICLILFKGNMSLDSNGLNPILFAFISSMLSIIFSIFIINISLVVTRYCKKFSISIVLSYLIFILYSIVSELLIGIVVENILPYPGTLNSFSIFNMVILDGNILIISIYAFILLILTTMIVILSYKNKEKVLREYE